jgi:hypothetical protein
MENIFFSSPRLPYRSWGPAIYVAARIPVEVGCISYIVLNTLLYKFLRPFCSVSQVRRVGRAIKCIFVLGFIQPHPPMAISSTSRSVWEFNHFDVM